MSTSAIQNNNSNSTIGFQLHAAPNWEDIFPKYKQIRYVWERSLSFSNSIHDKSIDASIMHVLKQHSSCANEKELHKFNLGMSEHCFYNGVVQSLDMLSVYKFSDGTQKTHSKKSINIGDKNQKAVIISLYFINKIYSEYQLGLSEYLRDSKGEWTAGDKELFLSKTGMNAMGHVGVAYLSETSDEYDLFETSNTVTGKYRVSVAMNESYGAQENHLSAAQFNFNNEMVNLQGDISCNLCNQYCLAYLLARQVSNDHVLILNFFQREFTLYPKEFISIIAGIKPTKQ